MKQSPESIIQMRWFKDSIPNDYDILVANLHYIYSENNKSLQNIILQKINDLANIIL